MLCFMDERYTTRPVIRPLQEMKLRLCGRLLPEEQPDAGMASDFCILKPLKQIYWSQCAGLRDLGSQ